MIAFAFFPNRIHETILWIHQNCIDLGTFLQWHSTYQTTRSHGSKAPAPQKEMPI